PDGLALLGDPPRLVARVLRSEQWCGSSCGAVARPLAKAVEAARVADSAERGADHDPALGIALERQRARLGKEPISIIGEALAVGTVDGTVGEPQVLVKRTLDRTRDRPRPGRVPQEVAV